MPDEILMDVGLDETRAVLLEDGELAEVYIERLFPRTLVGNIYVGKVCSILTGIQAAFIDIGYYRNAFLYFGDIIANKDLNDDPGNYPRKRDEDDEYCSMPVHTDSFASLKEGMQIMVQVLKDPFGSKGPRVTTNITLPGRYTVLLPNAEYIGVSRRIEKDEERARLRKTAQTYKPEGMGIIARTAAEGIDDKELIRDMEFLTRLWEKIKKSSTSGEVPRCIHEDMDLAGRTVRDMFTQDITRFVVNDRETYIKVRDMVELMSPALKDKVELFDRQYNMFEFYNIESRIARATGRKVWLKSGGYLVIDRTEALTVIDVNTGKYIGEIDLENTVLKTNLEAAAEIARQLRIRDIGGIIIIDFIDMNITKHQQMVIEELKSALKSDRTKTSVLGLTGLGLVEMTRKKVRQNLDSLLYTNCSNCDGTGKIPAPGTIIRRLEKELALHGCSGSAGNVMVQLHPSVAAYINKCSTGIISRLELKYDMKIQLDPSDKIKYTDVKITVIDN